MHFLPPFGFKFSFSFQEGKNALNKLLLQTFTTAEDHADVFWYSGAGCQGPIIVVKEVVLTRESVSFFTTSKY